MDVCAHFNFFVYSEIYKTGIRTAVGYKILFYSFFSSLSISSRSYGTRARGSQYTGKWRHSCQRALILSFFPSYSALVARLPVRQVDGFPEVLRGRYLGDQVRSGAAQLYNAVHERWTYCMVLEGQWCVEIVPRCVIDCERVTEDPEKVMDVDACSLKHKNVVGKSAKKTDQIQTGPIWV